MTVMLLEWVFTSAFLILVVLALRAALGKRVSAHLRYALWAVVLVRLLVPVQLFTSPIAGTWVFSETHTEQNVTEWPITSDARASAGPNDMLSLDVPGLSETLTTFPQVPAPPTVPDAPEPPEAPDLTRAPAWLGWIWLAGSAMMALVFLLSNLRFFWALRRERVPLDEADFPLRVYVAVDLPSPCLFGILRPTIYVTPDAVADPDMLRHVLAHEYTHYRQGDHIWSLLRCGALAVHWWNPLVWLAAVLSQRDAELACDEGALKRLGNGERAGYGNTLLALVTAKPRPGDLLRCATTMAGDKKSLKERISRIACAPKRILWAAIAAVLVTALACVCAFGQAAEPEDGPDLEPSESGSASDLEELAADLSFTLDENGNVSIQGTVDGLTLEEGTYWQPTDALINTLTMPYEPFSGDTEGYFYAWWHGSDHTAVLLNTNMMAQSVDAGFWSFTVDLAQNGGTVTDMVAMAGMPAQISSDTQLVLYPASISDEEAIRAARIAAKLLTEAEDYYYSSVSALPVEVEIAFAHAGNDPTSTFYVPEAVLEAAKNYVAEEFRGLAPAGWNTRAYDNQTGEWLPTNISDPSYFDRVRINNMEGPWQETRQGVQIEVWRINYEYHTTMLEKERSRLAGGMYITEDGWKCVIAPDCTYLFFQVVGDERRFLIGEIWNLAGPDYFDELDKDNFYREVDALLKDDPIDLPQTDLNRNGVPETLRVVEIDGGQRLEVWENGILLFSEEGYNAHVGYNAIFLCTLDGKDYLLRYHPYMSQGWCGYEYRLFTLENGQETLAADRYIEFDINFGQLMHESFDPEAIAAFMAEVNGLLAHSVQLLNTDWYLLDTFENEGQLVDTLWWLDSWEPTFVRDENKSLLENLREFKEAMAEQWHTETPTVFPVDELGTDILLRYKDEQKRFQGEWDYNFQPAEQVKPEVLDLNRDGRDEIVFSLIWGRGTGCLIEKLYVFDADTLEQYDTSGLNEMILSAIQSTGDEDNFYLSGTGLDVTIPKSEASEVNPYAPITNRLGFGDIILYTIWKDGEEVICVLGCDASGADINYIGYINIPIRMTSSGDFVCGQAQYTADNPS